MLQLKKESTSHNSGDNIVISTFPKNANPTVLNKLIVITATWAPQLGVNGSQVWCNGQKLRKFSSKGNVGATNFALGNVNASRLEAPFNGDIAELIILKKKTN